MSTGRSSIEGCWLCLCCCACQCHLGCQGPDTELAASRRSEAMQSAVRSEDCVSMAAAVTASSTIVQFWRRFAERRASVVAVCAAVTCRVCIVSHDYGLCWTHSRH